MTDSRLLDLELESIRQALLVLAADRAAGVTPLLTVQRVLSELGHPEMVDEVLSKSRDVAERCDIEPPAHQFDYNVGWWAYAHGYVCTVSEYPGLEALGGTPGEAIEAMDRQIAHTQAVGPSDPSDRSTR